MKTELIHKEAVFHKTGATFAFEPVGNAETQIFLDKITRADGSVRYVRSQEIGPFGNTALDAQGLEQIKKEWKPVAESMISEAFRCIAYAEGVAPNFWKGKVTDLTKPAKPKPKPKGGVKAVKK